MARQIEIPNVRLYEFSTTEPPPKMEFECRHLVKTCPITIEAKYDNPEKELKEELQKLEGTPVNVWIPLFLCSPRGTASVKLRGNHKFQAFTVADGEINVGVIRDG